MDSDYYDSFSNLGDFEMVSPIHVSPIRTVLPEGPSKPAKNPSPVRPSDQTSMATSTSGHEDREVSAEVRVDENHPHFINYEACLARHPYHWSGRTKFRHAEVIEYGASENSYRS